MPILAIDGRAGAGKSSLAAQLAARLPASLIHMDDFFLPLDLRTPDRLATPGRNFHYERFREEVLPYLRQGVAFRYRKFDCRVGDYGESIELEPLPWLIVEGAYSMSWQLRLSPGWPDQASTGQNSAGAVERGGTEPTQIASGYRPNSRSELGPYRLTWPSQPADQDSFFAHLLELILAQANRVRSQSPEVYYDCAIFCDISPTDQRKRILARNGPDWAQDFFQRWIPLEEAYLVAQKPQSRAQIILQAEEA